MRHTQDDQVRIAITMDNGTTAIMSFMKRGMSPTLPFGAQWEDNTGDSGIWTREPSDANIFYEISKALPSVNSLGIPKPQPVKWVRVEHDAIPTDRTYRNALVHDERGFSFDLPKAREIHLAKIRRARTAQLGELDKQWMRATGQRDDAEAARIEKQRQDLRDAPDTIHVETAQTIDELKALWPEGLPR